MADDTSYNDKRKNERIPAKFAVSFRAISAAEAETWAALDPDDPAREGVSVVAPPVTAAAPPAGRQPLSGHTENLSQGGLSITGDLQLLGDHRLERGSNLLVEFTLPGELEKVRCAAAVVWSLEGKGEKGKFTAGLMFLGMRTADLEKIAKYVEYRQ